MECPICDNEMNESEIRSQHSDEWIPAWWCVICNRKWTMSQIADEEDSRAHADSEANPANWPSPREPGVVYPSEDEEDY